MEGVVSWQSIRHQEIVDLYKRTNPDVQFEPFRRYVTQADLGPPYVNAPSEVFLPQADDLLEDIWIDHQ